MKVTNNKYACCCVAVGRGILLATQIVESQRELQHPYVKVMCLGCENLASNIHHHLWKKVPIAVSINNRVQGSGIQHLTPCFLKMILAVIPVRVGSEQL